jgi:hypothetical protein
MGFVENRVWPEASYRTPYLGSSLARRADDQVAGQSRNGFIRVPVPQHHLPFPANLHKFQDSFQ